MKKFYLHDGSQQLGPFDIEELKSKNLNRETPIWFEGIDEWTTIGKVDELKEIITATPPPFITKASSPPPVQKPIQQSRESAELPMKSSSNGRKLLIWVGLIVLGLIGYFVFNQIQHQENQIYRENTNNEIEDTKTRIRENITSYVTAEISDYTYREIGGIFNLTVYVNNNTDYLLDNVKVRVIYIKANGDVWDSNTVDFNLLEPNTKSSIKVPDTNRGTSVKYEIVSIKSAALGLN